MAKLSNSLFAVVLLITTVSVLAEEQPSNTSIPTTEQKPKPIREGSAPQIGGGSPPPMYMFTMPPPVHYCGPGETKNCRQLTASDNGAVVRGHSQDNNDEDQP